MGYIRREFKDHVFLTLKDIPAFGGGLAFPANCEFRPYDLDFRFDRFFQRYCYGRGKRMVMLKGPFIEYEDYKRIF